MLPDYATNGLSLTSKGSVNIRDVKEFLLCSLFCLRPDRPSIDYSHNLSHWNNLLSFKIPFGAINLFCIVYRPSIKINL